MVDAPRGGSDASTESGAGGRPPAAPTLPTPPPPPALAGALKRWSKILSAYFSTQTLTQLANIGAGLLFINFMPVEQFALYTLAFSVVTFFAFVSDLGSTNSLVYFFHQSRQQGDSYERQVAAVLSLRRLAFLAGGAAVVVSFPAIARGEGFALGPSLAVAVMVVACVWFQINSSIRVLQLRLADRYGRSYGAELAGAGVRLSLALLLVATAWLDAWLGVLASVLASATVARVALTAEAEVTFPAAEELKAARRKVLRYLLPTLPSALYFAVQAPLVVWLAATFGDTRNIAEVGALSRLGMVVGLFSGLVGVVFMPRLAQTDDEALYRRRSLQYGAALVAVAATLLAAAAAAPDLFLYLLGGNYQGLHSELLLVVAGAGLTLLGGYSVSINMARSWNRWQGPAVLAVLVAQVIFVLVLPLSSTWGVLLFNLLSGAVGLAIQLGINALGFTRPAWVHWS